MKRRWLPLGIDIGATRIRVAAAYATPAGPHIHAVAVREISEGIASSGAVSDTAYAAAVIEDAVAEVGVRERRCVSAIGEPDALLRSIAFPKMRAIERERSARFEAQRHIAYPVGEATIRLHPLDARRERWLIGIARSAAVHTRCAALRAAHLRPVAMEHESLVLLRSYPQFDAVLDVGFRRCSLHVRRDEGPVTLHLPGGGSDVTDAIVRELSLDERTAERRKRILGTAGAGERSRAALIGGAVQLVERARGMRTIERIALCGNGARLAGFAEDLQSALAAHVEAAVAQPLTSSAYPEDVVRSSAADWGLAAALAAGVR